MGFPGLKGGFQVPDSPVSSTTTPAGLYRIADISVDRLRASVTRSGEPIQLRPKCYDLLIHLIDHPNRIVTKKELIAGVWQTGSVSDDTIMATVSELRSVLSAGGEFDLIKTVRGRGYMLVAPEHVPVPAEPAVLQVRNPRSWPWRGTAIVACCAALIAASSGLLWRTRQKTVLPGEIGWWRFAEGSGNAVLDTSGHSNHGRLIGGVKRVATPYGPALEFDGLTGSVEGAGPGTGFPVGDSARTITCRLRSAAPPAEDVGLFHYGAPQRERPAANFHLFLDTKGRVGFGNGYNWSVCRSARSVTDGQWHFVSASFAGSAVRTCAISVDGALDNAEPLTVMPQTGSESSWTMGMFMAGGMPFRGLLADVRLFPYDVPGEDLTAIRNCTSPEFWVPGLDTAAAFILPLAGAVRASQPVHSGEQGPSLTFYSNGFSAVQLARADGPCSVRDMRGRALPAAIRLSARVHFGPNEDGLLLGPYFGGALPGAGISGAPAGNGVWVAASGSGVVQVRRLSDPPDSPPVHRVTAAAPAGSGEERLLRAEICGDEIRMSLDRQAWSFHLDQPATGVAGFAYWQRSKPRFSQLSGATDLRLETLTESECRVETSAVESRLGKP